MASINTSVAVVLIAFTALGVLFYLGVVVAGTSSYDCPFQTPASIILRGLWKRIGPHITVGFLLAVATGTSLQNKLLQSLTVTTLHHLWEVIQCHPPHAALVTMD